MQIAQVAPYFYPHVGGVESQVRALSRELADRGHEVTVITSRPKGLPQRESLDGFEVRRTKTITTLLKTPLATLKNISLDAYDIVHGHLPPPLLTDLAARSCQRKKIPFVLTHHCDPELPTPFGRALVGFYMKTFGRLTAAASHKIIVTTSSYVKTSRALWGVDNVCVVPNGVDIERFSPAVDGKSVTETYNPKNEPLLLFVGRLVPHKGLEYLIRALAQVNARCLIVGKGSEHARLENFARAVGVDERVVFTGYIPEAELPAYYAACDVFVLPSTGRLEAFGIVVLEAMATAKPVIVTDIPGVRELVRHRKEGLIVEPFDVRALAQAIETLIGDRDLRNRMGSSARERVLTNFTWDKLARDTEKIYEDVLAEK